MEVWYRSYLHVCCCFWLIVVFIFFFFYHILLLRVADAARVVLVLAVEEEVKVVVLTTRHPTGQHATRDERQDNMTRKETTEDSARRPQAAMKLGLFGTCISNFNVKPLCSRLLSWPSGNRHHRCSGSMMSTGWAKAHRLRHAVKEGNCPEIRHLLSNQIQVKEHAAERWPIHATSAHRANPASRDSTALKALGDGLHLGLSK